MQVGEHTFMDRYSVICSAANELLHRTDLSIHDIIHIPG